VPACWPPSCGGFLLRGILAVFRQRFIQYSYFLRTRLVARATGEDAMDSFKEAIGAAVSLESVLCTEQLEQRPSRPPDYQTENQALLDLVQELKNTPRNVLQRLVDAALELCSEKTVSEVRRPVTRKRSRSQASHRTRGRAAVATTLRSCESIALCNRRHP
jgi:hypothetical protein